MLIVRPKIAELVFHFYGRALHPELFEVYQTQTVERGAYTAKIDITSAGHVITWRYHGQTLTEVAAASNHPLPEQRRLMAHRLKGRQKDGMECRGGMRYDVNFSLDAVEPETFWTLQKELSSSEARQGMLQRFNSSGRMALGALSYVHVESRDRCLRVQAFHTFPDDYAIVKSQSVFQLP